MISINDSSPFIAASTRQQFGLDPSASLDIMPIGEGASVREYHRIRLPDGRTVIHCRHDGKVRENKRFPAVAKALANHDIPVPSLLAESKSTHEWWTEDIGDDSLYTLGLSASPNLTKAYKAAISALAKLHVIPIDPVPADLKPLLQPPFDTKLYREEQASFFKYFARYFTLCNRKEMKAGREDPKLIALAEHLASQPRCLIHRDFQSQNIHWHNNKPFFIDFQGIRTGLAAYDLASLLYDPYAPWITDSMRRSLLKTYQKAANLPHPPDAALVRDCAVQRLLQAMGAYARLSENHGQIRFRKHIPVAIGHLRELLEDHPAGEEVILTLRMIH